MASTNPDEMGQRLSRLWDARDWNRLEQKAGEQLASLPNDVWSNHCLAKALMMQGRYDEMGSSVRNLLEFAADRAASHGMAARYWIKKNQPEHAYFHARRMMELEPEGADGFAMAGLALCMNGQPNIGLQLLVQARNLNPEELSYSEIELKFRSVFETSALSRARQKEQLTEILKIDPERHLVHEMLGDFHAEVVNPRQAIKHYRAALAKDPGDTDCQAKLAALIPAQNILTRTLFLPVFAVRFFSKVVSEANLITFFVFLFCIKLVIASAVWLIVMGVLFGPPAKCYEMLFMADAASLSFKSQPVRRIMLLLNRIPFWGRVILMLAAWTGFWTGVLGWFGLSPRHSLMTVGTIFGIHFAIVCAWQLLKTISTRSAERRVRFNASQLLGKTFRHFALVNLIFIALGCFEMLFWRSFLGELFVPILTMLILIPADVFFAARILSLLWQRLGETPETIAELPEPKGPAPLPPIVYYRG